MATQPKVHKKLTEKSEAVKLLRSMFHEGKINSKTDPSTLYQSDAAFFTNQRSDPFRSRLNTLKREYRDLQGMYHVQSFSTIFADDFEKR